MKKHELLLQKEKCMYDRWTTFFNDTYRKVFMQHSLAENWEKNMKPTPAQGTITSVTF